MRLTAEGGTDLIVASHEIAVLPQLFVDHGSFVHRVGPMVTVAMRVAFLGGPPIYEAGHTYAKGDLVFDGTEEVDVNGSPLEQRIIWESLADGNEGNTPGESQEWQLIGLEALALTLPPEFRPGAAISIEKTTILPDGRVFVVSEEVEGHPVIFRAALASP